MPCRVLYAVTLFTALQAAAWGQAPQPTAYDGEQNKRLDKLSADLTALQGTVTKQGTELEALRELVKTQSDQIQTLADTVKEQSGQFQSFNTRFGALDDVVRQEHARILTDIARDDSGRYVPKLNAAMERESFRQEMDAAVHGSLRKVGRFRVVNKTASPQWIQINLRDHYLRAGEELILQDVPVGTVTTQLPGQSLVNWTLGHVQNGEYYESIDIVPQRVTMRYVETPWSMTPLLGSAPASVTYP
jgi:hypothetical protein